MTFTVTDSTGRSDTETLLVVVYDPAAGKVCGEPKDFGLFAIAAGIHVPPLAMILTGPGT